MAEILLDNGVNSGDAPRTENYLNPFWLLQDLPYSLPKKGTEKRHPLPLNEVLALNLKVEYYKATKTT
jgi:hypothetical protein